MPSSSNRKPETVPTDTIIPLNSFDDNDANRHVSIAFTMRFDDILDANMLASALWKLLEKPGWKKLGARLRMNASGKLEYHVPAQYSKQRPPINFTHVHHGDTNILEHPLGSKFPVAGDDQKIQSFDILEPLHDLTQPDDSPKVLADWIYTDKAQLSLHVVTFSDATLVTLTWLHTLLDAMGRNVLLSAWTAVLEERDDDLAEFWGYDFDPLESLARAQAQEEVEPVNPDEEREDFVAHIPSGRMICVPPSYMVRLRAEAMADIESLDSSELTLSSSTGEYFLSDGDILSAWLTRLMLSSNPSLDSSPAYRPVVFVNVLGLRGVLSTANGGYEALIPKGKAYIGNCNTAVQSLFGMKQLRDMPLGHIAAKLRKTIVVQGTREAVEASMRSPQKPAQEPDAAIAPVVIVCSNWAKGRFFETNFSAAIVGGKECGTGKPSSIHVGGHQTRPLSMTALENIVGKDGKGNYWVALMMFGGTSEAIDKAIEGMM